MPTALVIRNWVQSSQQFGDEEVVSANAGHVIDVTDIAVPSVKFLIGGFVLPSIEDCLGLFIQCDQDATLLTGDPDNPTDTVALSAGVPIIWTRERDGEDACPFEHNVTALSISIDAVEGVTTASLTIRSIYEPSTRDGR